MSLWFITFSEFQVCSNLTS